MMLTGVFAVALILFNIVPFSIGAGIGWKFKPQEKTSTGDDPNHCVGILGSNGQIFPQGVLPGMGWDNLLNRETEMVFQRNFSKCLTTDDRKYVLPNWVKVISMVMKDVEPRVELFDHWNNYTNTFSKNINEENTFSTDEDKLNGKFSTEFKNVKNVQINKQEATSRVQLRKTKYGVSVAPKIPLAKLYATKLRRIGLLLALNKTVPARFLAQNLVADYGTHVITGVEAGSALVQIERLKYNLVKDLMAKKQAILQASVRRFIDRFNVTQRYKREVTDVDDDTTMTSSETISVGGTKTWTYDDDKDDDVAVLDRTGIPLYDTISEETLPDLPKLIIDRIQFFVKKAVKQYYERNAIKGCMDPDSPNFSPSANLDDGSCQASPKTFALGGVYQVCESSVYKDMCEGMQQANPLTGDYSCPVQYTAIELDHGSLEDAREEVNCRPCWVVFQCCDTVLEFARANLTVYWCAPDDSTSGDSGLSFGGFYSVNQPNMATNEMGCPSDFSPVAVKQDTFICQGKVAAGVQPDAIPFGGFYSCRSGNPLAATSATKQDPMTCPEGYNDQLLDSSDDCEIHVCFQTKVVKSEPFVSRPPFMSTPWYLLRQKERENETSFVVNDDGTIWAPADKKAFVINKILQDKGINVDEIEGVNPDITPRELAAILRDRKNADGHVNVGWVIVGSVLATLSAVGVVYLGTKMFNGKKEKYTKI